MYNIHSRKYTKHKQHNELSQDLWPPVNKCSIRRHPFVPHSLLPEGNQPLLPTLPILGFYVNGIMHYLFLCVWLLSLNMFVRFGCDAMCGCSSPIFIAMCALCEDSMICLWASPLAQMVKNLQETWVRSLGQEDPLEKEMATYSSTLAWKIPWTEEPGGLQSMGSQRVGHDWATLLSLSYLEVDL